MKKAILPLILVLTLFLSGCTLLETLETEEEKILLEDGEIYDQDESLPGLTFKMLSEIPTENGINITFGIQRPDGSSESVYQQAFSPVALGDELFIVTNGIILYLPGRWDVSYEIDNLLGDVLLEGFGSLYVRPEDSNLAVFELIQWDCPTNVSFAESFYVNFTIKNTGMEEGTVDIQLLNTQPEQALTAYQSGHEWWSGKKLLIDDGEFSYSQYITLPESDLKVTLRFNEEEHSQIVLVGESTQTVDKIPMDLALGLVIVIILVGAFLVLRRP